MRVTGSGDVTYSTKRYLFGAISVQDKATYHLFSVDANASNLKDTIRLSRKSKWQPQHGIKQFEFSSPFFLY